MTRTKVLVALIALAGNGIAFAQEASGTSSETYGLAKSTAIEVCEPKGEREYLDNLACALGAKPQFERTGNVGPRSPLPQNLTDDQLAFLLGSVMERKPLQPGEADVHVVDAYEVSCGGQAVTLYMDMYHCPTADAVRAPLGFTTRAK